MKLKQSIRYQLEDFQMGILVYYCAAIAMTVLAFLAFAVYPGDSGIRVTGFSAITSVFLFVCGLCSLHENLPMALQNGVSRKTMFLARLAVTAITSAFCAVTDHVITAAANLAASPALGKSVSLLEQLFPGALPDHPVLSLTVSLLFSFSMLLLASTLGYCIICLFYRLPVYLRVVVGAAGGILLMFGLPGVKALDTLLFREQLRAFCAHYLEPLVNSIVSNPFSLMGSWVLAAGALSGISWLLLRRTIVH